VLNSLHDPADVGINDAVTEFKPLTQLIETEKKRMLKIPGDIAATPGIVLCTGVKPMNKERTNS
jgi:hypothetical protein